MRDLDGRKGIYHFLKWHSTTLNLADLEFVGEDALVQYFDTDKQSLFDAIDNYMRNALLGTMVSDRQGKLWVEVGAYMYANPTGSFPPIMTIERRDWMNEPSIEERLNNEVSFVEVGGVAYSGDTGTFQPFISNAPGLTPDGRGSPENIPGLALQGQDQLNKISGNVYANANAKYPAISLDLTSNFRNLDIAPMETVDVDIKATDTVLGIPIHAPYLIDSLQWNYDVGKKLLVPNISLTSLVNGQEGITITIPDLPVENGFGTGEPGGIGTPTLPIISMISPTYTWTISIPAIDGIPGAYLTTNRTALSINSYCVGGTSVTFNIEARTEIGTPGTPLCSSDIVATPTGVVGLITDPVLPIGSWLWLEIKAVSGMVSKFVVTLGVS